MKLNLPEHEVKIINTNEGKKVFDSTRKKWLKLTPEEWVRQNFIAFMVADLNYPVGNIQIESALRYNGRLKRFDALVYNQLAQPLLLLEFKAPNVEIKQAVFDQIAVYNFQLKVPFLIVSNGLQHYSVKVNHENQTFDFLNRIPSYEEITA